MIGKIVADRYEISSLLGTGGMARVYLAKDLNLGREIALKVLLDSVAQDAEFRERFRREARASAALSHPNIVQVYDFFEAGQDIFLVMELIEGRDLRSYMTEHGRFAPQVAVRIICDVLSALEFAHSRGVVHRDISARNVMLANDGTVKVADFGIARIVGERTLTQSGELIGSVQYISPEQASGQHATPRTDVYSTGVLLYEMLTGELPFKSDNAVQLALMHVQKTAVKPSTLCPDINGALDQIVMKAMAKNPMQRFRSAGEMLEALLAFTNPQNMVAPAQTPFWNNPSLGSTGAGNLGAASPGADSQTFAGTGVGMAANVGMAVAGVASLNSGSAVSSAAGLGGGVVSGIGAAGTTLAGGRHKNNLVIPAPVHQSAPKADQVANGPGNVQTGGASTVERTMLRTRIPQNIVKIQEEAKKAARSAPLIDPSVVDTVDISSYDEDYQEELPDGFFYDDNGNLVNANGHLIDEDGNLIDENGNWVDENGNWIDEHGHLIDENGNWIDENGNLVDENDNIIEDVGEDEEGSSLPLHGLGAVIAVTLTVLLAFIGGITWVNFHSTPMVDVPVLVGQKLTVAKQTAKNSGLRLEVRSQKYEAGAMPGVVLVQDPVDGSRMAKDGVVWVEVSIGRERVAVPDLSGLSEESACSTLSQLGLGYNIIPRESSAAEGMVFDQKPSAGAEIAMGNDVTIFVSIGQNSTRVPELYGMSLKTAQELAASLGGEVRVKEQKKDDKAKPGSILKQEPAAGTILKKGQIISVVICAPKKESESPSATAQSQAAPNMVGKTVDEAKAAAAGLGLKLIVDGDTSGNASIVSQQVEPGALLSDGSLRVTAATQHTVPDVCNQTYESALQRIQAAGFKVGRVSAVEGQDNNIVIEQYPGPGQPVAAGSSIDITVTKVTAPAAGAVGGAGGADGGNGEDAPINIESVPMNETPPTPSPIPKSGSQDKSMRRPSAPVPPAGGKPGNSEGNDDPGTDLDLPGDLPN